MIVVDTSALMAIALDEPAAKACMIALSTEKVAISATTYAETMIVAGLRGSGARMAGVLGGLSLEVVSVTPLTARFVAEVYGRWGKGAHPASLNFADCFAYALAKERDCPLLYIGSDFARTDVRSALA